MEETNLWFRQHKIWTGILFFIALLVIIAVLNNKKQTSPKTTQSKSGQGIKTAEWDSARAKDAPQVSNGWTRPVRLAISEDGMWDDSLFVALDGARVYFIYYPGDLLSDTKTGKFKTNGQIYFSDKPFVTKVKDERPYFNEKYWSPAGPSITANGDIFYHSNKPIEGDNKRYLSHIYKNGELLPFNNSEISYNNPQYCEGKDELWLDSNDKEIYFLKNAQTSGFKGRPTLAPKPINSYDPKISESQPWLSDDCNTLYFSSTRDHVGSGPFIYTSKRTSDDQWNKPQLVIKSKVGVGEPTLTIDMKKLFFIQVLQNSEGNFTTNLFYTEEK